MARSPFSGTFQPNVRPTVVTSPDAIVYINGEPDIVSCPSCKKRFDISKYITSIQVDLNIDSPPGTATINLSVPRHVIDDFLFDGVPILSPMMEIEIFAKGYYLLEGLPQYYPIFWGLVTEVGDNYSAGEHTVSIQCADILKWWELCKMNINPAFTGPSGSLGRSLFGNTFFGLNPYDVIYTLAQQSFGDVVIGTGSLTSLFKENGQKSTFNAALADIMVYWNERFSRIRSNLLLYGVNGVAVSGADLNQSYQTGKFTKGTPIASSAVRTANGKNNDQLVFDPTSKEVVAFRTQVMQAGEINFWQSEYQTKLELATAAKEAIGFEFFMDVTGDIVFKPPFYNMDVLSNKPVSWIQDIDVIDWDFSDSESEVVTQLTMQGNFTGNADYGLNTEELTPYTSVTDYHLLRKYGWRSHTYNSEFLGDTQLMFYHGLDMLDRINSTRHRGSVSIPMRPELRLGFPIYIAPKDQVWYVQGLSHNIQFGGRATTTVSLTARRGKFIAPKGIGTLSLQESPKGAGATSPKKEEVDPILKDILQDRKGKDDKPSVKELARKHFKLNVGKAAQVPAISFDPLDQASVDAQAPLILRHPKTGRICGYPNVVMVYTRPFTDISLDEFKRVAGKGKGQAKQVDPKIKEKITAKLKKNDEDFKASLTDENLEKLTSQHNANRWRYGLNSAGVFVYAQETAKVVTQFALLPAANIDVTVQGQATKKLLSKGSAMIRPVSDDRGFEVIGHYRYGRGIALRDGRLELNPGETNTGTTVVGVQLALGGDLYSTLQSQSQGLTTIGSAYANPADALARMQPDDLQTAATITPGMDSSTAKFSNTGTTFVDAAPLGSPEQIGLPVSVEASQLSRALTLAEMSINDDPDAGFSCGCGTKGDLAFINVGYKLKTVGTATTTSDLFNQDTDTLTQGELQPVDDVKFSSIKNQVEGFLWNLYDALDQDHHEYEQKLRGSVTNTEPENFEEADVATDPTRGSLSPPFSVTNRAGVGDPVATALTGSSAANDLQSSWKNFGKKLKEGGEKFGKAKEVAELKKQLAALRADLDRATQATPQDTALVQSLQREVATVQQRIQNLETEIGTQLCPREWTSWGRFLGRNFPIPTRRSIRSRLASSRVSTPST